MTLPASRVPVLGDRPKWERHRRGRYAVLLCPGRRVLRPAERCPYTVIIASPRHATDEEQAAKAAADHWDQIHGGMLGDQWHKMTHGGRRLDLDGELHE